MYSMFKYYEKCLRYYSFNKWAQNHRSLTLRRLHSKLLINTYCTLRKS